MVRTLGTLVVAATVGTFAIGGIHAQGTTTTQQPAQSTEQTPPEGKANEAAARQALVQARESLAELSKSPEAAQLQGQARTEVSEIINSFNALLAAESGWYEQYRSVMQNLHNVLGPTTSEEAAAGASATGTSGTTAGTTATTGEVPSALRSQLVDFRAKLMEFGRAAGAPDVTGGVTASSATGTSGTTGAAGTTGSPAIGTTGTSGTATSGTSTSGTTGTSPSADQATGSAAASETLEHHLDAINDIIQEAMSGQPSAGAGTAGSTTGTTSGTAGSTTGTTGSATGTSGAAANPPAGAVTIDRAKLDSIQSHLQRIREIARSKGIR